tara:strand:- start:1280 stop:2476 length:1197 start_codon:yes stop_codon:yes gene_type:complete
MTPQNSLSSSDKVYKEIESQINDMIRAGLSSNEIEREIDQKQLDYGYKLDQKIINQILDQKLKFKINSKNINPKPDPLRGSSGFISLPQYKFEPFTEIKDKPIIPKVWIWENRLKEGGISIITAKPKVGKSIFAMNLAVNVVRGTRFLDWETLKGKVLYMALEGDIDFIKEQISLISDNQTDQLKDLLLHVGFEIGDQFPTIKQNVIEHKPKLLIIDTLFKLTMSSDLKDLNNPLEVHRFLEPYVELAREYKTHIQFIHHSQKKQIGSGVQILGSTGIFAVVDSAIQINKTQNTREMITQQRDGDEVWDPIILVGGTRESNFKISTAGSMNEHHLDDASNQILEFLDLNGDSNYKDIKSNVSKSDKNIRLALSNLIDNGVIKKIKDETDNRTLSYRKV